MMTYLGLVGALMVFLGYLFSNLAEHWLWVAIAGYLVHWFGDSTDGSLARYRKIERPRYGYFLDHSCDGLATTLVVVGIGLSPYVTLEVALFALAGYSLAFAWVHAGHEVNLKELGLDERFIVCKTYWGRPRPEDTLPGQYDLSNVDPRDERRNFKEEELEDWRTQDMTIIVVRKSGGQGIVFYIPDFGKEVDVYDMEPWGFRVASSLIKQRVPS